MATTLDEYFDALARLKSNCPVHVPKGTKITNDAVSLEAGRSKGSIKKSRPLFADLIAAIDTAAAVQAEPGVVDQAKIAKSKAKVAHYRGLYEEAIAREVSLLKENFELKRELQRLGGKKVVSTK